MHQFKAEIQLIGINPFVSAPVDILKAIFKQAGKEKGTFLLKERLMKKPCKQTLVRYEGEWRLYINTDMLKNSPKRIGEQVDISLEFDPEERIIPIHPKLSEALKENNRAATIFENLRPSRKLEIVRYLSFLKTEESVDRNVARIMDFLLGKGRFVGKDTP
jgi:Bacteriocin-protection, YdeI or OmpD-Associated